MAIAAVPAYLPRDLASASPGLRFGMYLQLWQEDSWSKIKDKVDNLKPLVRLNQSDKDLMAALRKRQAGIAAAVDAAQLLRIEAIAVAPFTTGLGNEHPLENGFAFLNPYGLPYLAGSGVKGVLRKAAGELARGLFGGTEGWDEHAIEALFGSANANVGGDDTNGQRGALMVWDVLPEIAGKALQIEIMTAHSNHYLQGDQAPHESGQPNPINFLSVPPGSKFDFAVRCDLPFLQRVAPELVADERWKGLLQAALHHAFDWLGFGAKTAVGYGAMMEDPAARRHREQAAQAQREARETAEQARQRAAEIAHMSPARKAMAEYFDARPAGEQDQSELQRTLKGLEQNEWMGELRVEIARELKRMMVAEEKWKPTTKKKKPERDREHQATLFVMRVLDGK